MLVKDMMKSKIITVDANDTVRDACNKYRDHKVGCLIVTNNEEIAGLVTERDVIKRTICMDKDPNTTKIAEIMSTDVKTIDPYAEVDDAIRFIKEHKIKKIPVASNGRLVGIITITDLAHTRPTIKRFLEYK